MGIYSSFPLLVADSHGFQKGDFWALTPHNKAFSASVYGGIISPSPLENFLFLCCVCGSFTHFASLPLFMVYCDSI